MGADLSIARRPRPARETALAKYAAAIGIFLASALVASATYGALHATGLAMVFLAGVLIAAVNLGARAAYLTAFLAFVTYDFYIAEPIHSFVVTSPADMAVLIMFPLAALLTGGLAGRARDEGERAKAREISANILYAASRQISSIWDEAEIRRQLARHMAAAAAGPAMVWTSRECFLDPPEAWTGPGPAQPEALLAAAAGTDGPAWTVRELREDEPSLGKAAWRSPGPVSAEVDRLLDVLVDLGSPAVVRARVGASRSEMEALAQTEKLRGALLSSISHDFRTPLAAILASATSLRTLHARMDAAHRDDLLATIQEEAERLNRFVTNLMHMARLESGVVEPRRGIVDVAEVIDATTQRLGRGRWEGRLCSRLETPDLLAEGDPILLDHALGNVVENALRFSGDERPVAIRARGDGDGVRIAVTDEGPGVKPDQLPRIFEKFYQAGNDRPETSGAGLGLSIARGLVEAMRGSIVARNREGGGLEVTLWLPGRR